MVAGAVGGTIPDLDIIFYPFLDSVSQLGFHRGLSHSFTFAILAAPVFGMTARKLSRAPDVSTKTWTLVGFWAFATHILLDTLTVYGTGLFEPFSSYRAALNVIFIIDPLYTVPLAAGLLAAAVAASRTRRSIVWTWIGLGLSTAYLLWSGVAKSLANRAFEDRFAAGKVDPVRYISTPTPLNTILWRALAEVDEGYYESYYSILSDVPASTPEFIPRNDSLLAPVRGTRALRTVRWFSDGFYSVSSDTDLPLFHDLRFGRAGFEEGPFALTIAFTRSGDPGNPGIEERWFRPSPDDPAAMISELWDRFF